MEFSPTPSPGRDLDLVPSPALVPAPADLMDLDAPVSTYSSAHVLACGFGVRETAVVRSTGIILDEPVDDAGVVLEEKKSREVVGERSGEDEESGYEDEGKGTKEWKMLEPQKKWMPLKGLDNSRWA